MPKPRHPDQTSSAERSLLNNRFSVLKNRSKVNGLPFGWASFKEWLRDLEALLAPGENITHVRVIYNQRLAPGYCRENMQLMHNAKAQARQAETTHQVVCQAGKLLEEDPECRVAFASDLVWRILNPENQGTLSEMIADAAQVAGLVAVK